MATVTYYSNTYSGRKLRLVIEQTQNIASNKSTLKWTLYSEGGSSNYYTIYATTIKINGTQVYYKGNTDWSAKVFPAAKGSVSGSIEVAHNVDGSLSVPVYFYTAVYSSSNKKDYGGVFTLDKNPRAATITAAPDFNDEQNPTISYSNPAGNAVTALDVCITFNGNNDDIKYRSVSKTGSSYTFSFTDAERKTLRQWVTAGSPSREVRFYLRTNIGGTYLYSKVTKKLTIINDTPTLSPTVETTDSISKNLTGNKNTIIKGISSVNYAINAQAYKEAAITEQYVQNDGKFYATAESSLTNLQSGSFLFAASDNRGRRLEKPITKGFIDYVKLTSNLQATITLDGETTSKITYKATGSYWGGNFGAVSNALEAYYVLKVDDTQIAPLTPTGYVNINTANNTYEVGGEITGLDYKETYTLQISLLDQITNISSNAVQLTTIPVYDWSKDDFNFNVPVKINNKELDYIVEQGTKDNWFYRKWNSGLAECWQSLTISGVDVGEFNLDGMYYCGSKGVNFPFTFKSVNYINATGGSTGNMNIVRPFNYSNSNMTYIVLGMSDRSSVTVNVNLEAKGTWK